MAMSAAKAMAARKSGSGGGNGGDDGRANIALSVAHALECIGAYDEAASQVHAFLTNVVAEKEKATSTTTTSTSDVVTALSSILACVTGVTTVHDAALRSGTHATAAKWCAAPPLDDAGRTQVGAAS
jgi:hypothetical protein